MNLFLLLAVAAGMTANRLPARPFTMPLADETAALTGAIGPETPYVKSLNGNWKIRWAANPTRRPLDFQRVDYDDSGWNTIDVPSCMEMRGYGVPGEREAGCAADNPVTSYRTTFTVPESWRGRDVILRFDGVSSVYTVWVNGRQVGHVEDSTHPSEFEITSALVDAAAGGVNTLAVEVFRWGAGESGAPEDAFGFSGIFREVTLWAQPKDGIWDFAVRTRPLDGYESWSLELDLERGSSASLYDAEKKNVGDLVPVSGSRFELRLRPRVWSAEDPYLYTLVIRKGSDIRATKVAFREQKIVGDAMLVNGRPVTLKGVTWQETSPDNGRTVSLKEMLTDVTLMKRCNINAVCLASAENPRLWTALCDAYGLYVVDAAVGDFRPWVDQAIRQATDRVDAKSGARERRLVCVGAGDGLADPLRRALPKLLEVAHANRDLRVTRTDDAYVLENRLSFTSADAFVGRWDLRADGQSVATGRFLPPAVPPGATCRFAVGELDAAVAQAEKTAELFVNFDFATTKETPWAGAGWILARDQIVLREGAVAPSREDDEVVGLDVEEAAEDVTIECGRTIAIFDRETGTLSGLQMNGVGVFLPMADGLVPGPQLTSHLPLQHHPGKIVVDGNIVRVTVDAAGPKGCGFTEACDYVFHADGSLTLKTTVTPYGTSSEKPTRLGLTMRLPAQLEAMRYYGRGPEGLNIYGSTVTEQVADYVLPTEDFGLSDVRWVEFSRRQGRQRAGVRFTGATPMVVSASHFTREDLAVARQVNGRCRPRTPLAPREEVIFDCHFNSNEPFSWELTISPTHGR